MDVFRRYLICIFISASLIQAYGQTPVLKIESTGLCQSDTVIVPLTSSDLNNVGAITLYINFPPSGMQFIRVANIHPLLENGLMFNASSSPPRISIVWSSASGVNLGSAKLLDLVFELSDSSALLHFSEDSCEIANASIPPEIMAVEFTDGEVFESTPAIISQPEERAVAPGSNCVFSIEAQYSTGYRWWESPDFGVNWVQLFDGGLYSGTSSPNLALGNIPDSYNGYLYRCEVQREECRVDSKTALLRVGPQYSVNEMETQLISIFVKPNPCSDRLRLSVWTANPGNLEVEFFSLQSKIIITRCFKIDNVGLNEFELNVVSLPIGLTMCKYKFEASGGFNHSSGVFKIVRLMDN